MKKRIAIIGLGDIAQKAYLPTLSTLANVEIVGVMSKTEATVKRIGEHYRIQGQFTELSGVLKEQPDAIFIHSPTETHADLVIECLKQGIHVYVDKPLSYDIQQAITMANTAERYDRLLCVGFNRRFAPRYQDAKAWLQEVGGFDVCVAQKHRMRQQTHSAKHTLYDDLIHMLDLLIWLNEGSCELKSYAQRVDAAGKLVHASGILKLAEASGFFCMDRHAGHDVEKLELHGGFRSVEVTNLEKAVFYDIKVGEQTKHFGSWDSVLYRRGFVGVVEHFLASLDQPDRCLIRADQVMPTHELIEKLT